MDLITITALVLGLLSVLVNYSLVSEKLTLRKRLAKSSQIEGQIKAIDQIVSTIEDTDKKDKLQRLVRELHKKELELYSIDLVDDLNIEKTAEIESK